MCCVNNTGGRHRDIIDRYGCKYGLNEIRLGTLGYKRGRSERQVFGTDIIRKFHCSAINANSRSSFKKT